MRDAEYHQSGTRGWRNYGRLLAFYNKNDRKAENMQMLLVKLEGDGEREEVVHTEGSLRTGDFSDLIRLFVSNYYVSCVDLW
jgi:hypothetical protein